MRAAPMSSSKPAPTITLSEADRKNGWTEQSLAEHIAQAEQAEYQRLMNRLFPDRPPIRVESVASFDPHNW